MTFSSAMAVLPRRWSRPFGGTRVSKPLIQCQVDVRLQPFIHSHRPAAQGRVETPEDRWWQWPAQTRRSKDSGEGQQCGQGRSNGPAGPMLHTPPHEFCSQPFPEPSGFLNRQPSWYPSLRERPSVSTDSAATSTAVGLPIQTQGPGRGQNHCPPRTRRTCHS